MQDLRGMCLKLGIQVDNPISILDQNTAKTFLLQNKPGDLYHLFMKASDLETLRLLHEEIDRLQKQTDQEIRKKKRVSDQDITIYLFFCHFIFIYLPSFSTGLGK